VAGAVRGLALALCLLAGMAAAEVAPAVPGPPAVEFSRRGALAITLPLDRAVPWRAFTEGDPPRLVIDAAAVDWSGLPEGAFGGLEARWGRVGPGWTRLVLLLDAPVALRRAWMESDPPAIRIEAVPGAGRNGPLVARDWDEGPAPATRPRQGGDRPLVIALDPGHGGFDPGAERRGIREADLMLRFAGELALILEAAGHEVVLTRETDAFVALRGRTAMARAAGADLMISLHADAVEGGGAGGATVYTLSDAPAGALSAELVERQGRGDLLLGVELPEPGDEVARILAELARLETAPRAQMLADALVEGIGAAGIDLHARPRLEGEFTVLKAADIPVVLLELGFMSSEGDLDNLLSADWRGRMAVAILRGIEAWAVADAEAARHLRR
jgi:N-acetylmuramoyl-L-alanine amidase